MQAWKSTRVGSTGRPERTKMRLYSRDTTPPPPTPTPPTPHPPPSHRPPACNYPPLPKPYQPPSSPASLKRSDLLSRTPNSPPLPAL